MPLGKLGYHLPRTLSNRISSRSSSRDPVDPDEPEEPFHIRDRVEHFAQADKNRRDTSTRGREEPARPVFRIGGSVIRSGENTPTSPPTASGTPDGKITEANSLPEQKPGNTVPGEKSNPPTDDSRRNISENDAATSIPLQNYRGSEAV